MPQVAPKPKTIIDDLGREFTLDFHDVGLERHRGASILLPEGMGLSEGIFWLKTKQKDEETVVEVNERLEGYPIDVAYALQLSVQEIFGIRELRSTPGIFGTEKPPMFITVPTDYKGNTVEVFMGRFAIPGIEGYLETSRDWNDALWVRGKVKRKSILAIQQLMKYTRQMLTKKSLYKGKAFRVYMVEETQGFETKMTMANPEFIDVTKAPAQLMLNKTTEELLTAALWVPIERTEQTREYGVSLKRGILLEGVYGTGKSLTALETAKKAQENGWTFLYLKDVKDLRRIYQVAARWAPSVIFAEDIDLVVKHEGENNEDGINMLNNVLDGIDGKNQDVILVLTTNHVDQIPQSMLRPGRFDAIIDYHLPDEGTAARLVKQYGGGDIDADNFDMKVVGEHLQGKQPATLHEIVKRAKLYAQMRFSKDYRGPLKLATQDIILSNASMENHLRLLSSAPNKNPSAVEQFAGIISKEFVRGVWMAMRGKDALSPGYYNTMHREVTDPAHVMVEDGPDTTATQVGSDNTNQG